MLSFICISFLYSWAPQLFVKRSRRPHGASLLLFRQTAISKCSKRHEFLICQCFKYTSMVTIWFSLKYRLMWKHYLTWKTISAVTKYQINIIARKHVSINLIYVVWIHLVKHWFILLKSDIWCQPVFGTDHF